MQKVFDQRSGARRFKEEPTAWQEMIPNPRREIPLTVDGSALTFRSRDIIKRLKLSQGLEQEGKKIYFGEEQVGEVDRKEVRIPTQNPNTPTFWQGVDSLWRNVNQAGLKTDIRV